MRILRGRGYRSARPAPKSPTGLGWLTRAADLFTSFGVADSAPWRMFCRTKTCGPGGVRRGALPSFGVADSAPWRMFCRTKTCDGWGVRSGR